MPHVGMTEQSPCYFLAARKPDLDQGLTDEEFAFITAARLRDPGYWDRLYATVLWMDEVHEAGLAQKLIPRIAALQQPAPERPVLSSQDEEKLSQLILLLKVVALPVLKPRDMEEVCRSGVALALRAGLNLHAGIRYAFIFTGEPELAVPLAQTIMRVLGTNAEIIGDSPIVDPETGERMPPTVANWLRQYNGAFPVGVERGPIERAQYLQRDQNVKQIRSGERELLTRLLEVYDLLRFPHRAPVGEEGGGEPVVDRRRTFQLASAATLPPPVSGPATAEQPRSVVAGTPMTQILAAYQGATAFERSVAQQAERLRQIVGSDGANLRAAFLAAVQAKHIARTVASLRLMAENGELERMLSSDERLRRYLIAVWPGLYGEAAAVQFADNPASRQSVQKFLQYLVQERLGMSESDAARVGAQLANIFMARGQTEYEKLAYFDVKSKTFKWLETNE